MTSQLDRDRQLVEKLCRIEDGLTDWEVRFVEDVARRVERGEVLAPGTREKAEEILEQRG